MNNLIYGMTGGQVSGLSTNEFKVDKNIPDDAPPFDVCELAHRAGAAYVTRVNNPKNITAKLKQAFKTPGFSLVEIPSLCQPYGAKKMDQLIEWSRDEVFLQNDNPVAKYKIKETKSLIDENQVLPLAFNASIEGKIGIMLAGSAGGGVQSAAQLLAKAGILSGLSASMKGEYPITVGTGFSVAEVILSKDEINYTGLEKPDVVIIVTNDGLLKVQNRISGNAKLYLDAKVNKPENLHGSVFDFNGIAGKKGSALAAITCWLADTNVMDIQALKEAARKHKYGDDFLLNINSALELLVL